MAEEQVKEKFLKPDEFDEFMEKIKIKIQEAGWKLRPFRMQNVKKKLPPKELWWRKDKGKLGLPAILFKFDTKHIARLYPRTNTSPERMFNFLNSLYLEKNDRNCKICTEPYHKNAKFEYCGVCFYHFCVKNCKENLKKMNDNQGREICVCPHCQRPMTLLATDYFSN